MGYCQYFSRNNIQCNIKYQLNYQLENKFYCKKHFDIMNKRNNIIYCEYINKKNNNCKTKAKDKYSMYDKFYCKKHFDFINGFNKEKVNKEKVNKEKVNKEKVNDEKVNDEEFIEKKKILKEVNMLKNIKITSKNKLKIKKNIFNLLLKTHPDKCKNSMIDSHSITQELNNILEKIKKINL